MKRGKVIGALVILLLTGMVVLTPFLLVAAIFGNLSEETEVYRVESPDGSRYAVVIESGQGAMGGATWVNVVEKPRKFLLFTIQGSSRRVYSGRWGEHYSIQVSWQDDHTLLINGEVYSVKSFYGGGPQVPPP